VEGNREHRVVSAEDRVRPVPVVDVPVDDRDPLDAESVLCVPRCDRDVAEEAEAHRVTP
jgi:hypothetical protein